MSAVKNVILSIFKLKYGAHKSEAVINFGDKNHYNQEKMHTHTQI